MRNTCPAANTSLLLSLRFSHRVSTSSVCYLEQPIYPIFNDQISNHAISFSWLRRKTQDLSQLALELRPCDRSARFPECRDDSEVGLPGFSQRTLRLADVSGRAEEAREGLIPEKFDVGGLKNGCAHKTQTAIYDGTGWETSVSWVRERQ